MLSVPITKVRRMLMFLPFAVIACTSSDSTAPAADADAQVALLNAALAGAPPPVVALAKEVHAVTARFHSTVQATKAGYAVDSPCVAVPGVGAMGIHWVNHSLVDATFDPLRPEAVLYEPGNNGQLKLVGVEYIVLNTGQTAPTFAGQPFDVGGNPMPDPHWTLHLWIHKPNPSGLFAPFNPDVTCPAP